MDGIFGKEFTCLFYRVADRSESVVDAPLKTRADQRNLFGDKNTSGKEYIINAGAYMSMFGVGPRFIQREVYSDAAP